VKRRVPVGVALLALAVGSWVIWGSGRRPEHPNVLIVLWDTVRADRMSLYGHDRPTTPALDAFARDAVVYENAVSPGIWTVPSHGAMFTGLPPSSHGASFDWRWLDHHHLTLAEWFQQHGYDTFAFSANPNLARRGANLLQGFHTVQTSWNARWWPLVNQVTQSKLLPDDASTEISPAFPGGLQANQYFNGGVATERALLKWLDVRPDDSRPWLAYLNYMEAHKPRVPAQRFRKAVMTDAERELALRTDVTFLQQLAFGHRAREYTPEELGAIRAVYDASIRELDFFTERLFESLDARGVLDDTIVVLTSDHGETLGEHHRMGHRFGVYESLLHVPLVVRWPRGLPAARVKEPVSTLDLFASVTSLAGLPLPASAGLTRPWSLGREAVFSEVIDFDQHGLDFVRKHYPEVPAEGWRDTFRAVRSGDLKLVMDADGHTTLFDVAADPGELTDLGPARPADTTRLRAAMTAWFDALPAYDASKRSTADMPVIQPKEKEMLEVLGYIVDEPAP
jgi:arylsulfatase A-like enzyme